MSNKLVAANLVEVSYADSSKDLVSWGKRIFHGSYGLGRIIKWLNSFSCIGKEKEKRLNEACGKTRDLFFNELVQLEKANRALKNGFKRLLVGKEIKGRQFSRAKDRLLSFSVYFAPFMKAMRKNQSTKALSFLTADIEDQEEVQEAASTMKELFEELRFYQKIFNFEEVTKAKIPLHFLQKMSFNARLNVREEKKVGNWLEQLYKSEQWMIPSLQGKLENSYVQTRSMHRMLCKIVAFINEHLPDIDEDYDAEVEALEANLVDRGYQIFDKTDFKHIAWRESLDSGEEIHWNGKTIVLDEILQNPERNIYEPVVFSVVDEPHLEVVMYHNESWSYLKRFQESILHCGIQGKEILGLSAFGRIVIQERLYDSLADIEWESNGITDLTKKDREKAKPIVELLTGLIKRPFTPMVGELIGNRQVGALHPEHFAFNAENQLKATECLVPGRFSFDALENFAYECSRGNFVVFSHILNASGMSKISAARSYQRLYADALNGADRFVATTLNSSIIDDTLIEKREDFYDYIRGSFEENYDYAISTYKLNKKRFKNQLIEELIRIHKIMSPGSILDPGLFGQALYNLCEEIRPALREQKRLNNKVRKIIAKKNGDRFLSKKDTPYFDKGIFAKKQIQYAREKIAKARKSKRPAAEKSDHNGKKNNRKGC